MGDHYNVEVFPGYVLATLHPGFDPAQHQQEVDNAAKAKFDAADGMLFLVIDLSGVRLDIEQIMLGATMGGRADDALWTHRSVRGLLFITTDAAIRMAVEGLHSPMFGELNAWAFDTLEEARAYIAEQDD